MGHLHRQALVQRAKQRDALAAANQVSAIEAKAVLAPVRLAHLHEGPNEAPELPRAKPRKVARKKGKKRASKKKA